MQRAGLRAAELCVWKRQRQRDGFAAAFQAGMVYFCWKHNCLWLRFGSTFCPPNCQELYTCALLPSCGDLVDLPFQDTKELGEMCVFFQGVNTVQVCCAVVRSEFMHEYMVELSVVLRQVQHCEERIRKEKESKRVRTNATEA